MAGIQAHGFFTLLVTRDKGLETRKLLKNRYFHFSFD